MLRAVEACLDTILQTIAGILGDTDQNLTDTQFFALYKVDLYSQQLLELMEEKPNPQLTQAPVSHYALVDLVTPILGYAEMLVEGWMGHSTSDLLRDFSTLLECTRQLSRLLLKRQIRATQEVLFS